MLSATNSEDPNNVSPANNGIFFYSYGKYSAQCAGGRSKSRTSTSPPVRPPSSRRTPTAVEPPCLWATRRLWRSVNGVALNPANILATSGTEWPIDRFVFNVYSNGSDTTHPSQAATPATLNYVSEVGFLCKPQTNGRHSRWLNGDARTEIIDPATDTWYHTEIFNDDPGPGLHSR